MKTMIRNSRNSKAKGETKGEESKPRRQSGFRGQVLGADLFQPQKNYTLLALNVPAQSIRIKLTELITHYSEPYSKEPDNDNS